MDSFIRYAAAVTPACAASGNGGSGRPTVAVTDAAVRVALVVRVEAKPGKENDVEQLFTQGVDYVNAEAGTPYWFGVKLGPRTFGIFDAFPDDEARQAHLAGKLAAILMANAAELLAAPPSIEKVEIVAMKDTWSSGTAGRIRVGISARMIAKQGKEAELTKLLDGGLAIVQREERTPIWFLVRFDASTYRIFDAFVDEPARDAHLGGDLAKALLANAPELLAEPPSIEKVTVLASKLPR